MSNPWFRMYSDFIFDEKVEFISFEDQRHFVFLLCMKNNGLLDKEYATPGMLEKVIARRLAISESDLTGIKMNLLRAKLIDVFWQPLDWKRHKAHSDRPQANIWSAIRSAIFARDDYTCQYCGDRGKKLECDHVVPVSKGGSHDDANLVTACYGCNRSKGSKLMSEWEKT